MLLRLSYCREFIVLWLCMLPVVFSCEKSTTDKPGQQTTPKKEGEVRVLSSTNLEFTPEGGTLQISFTSSDSWTAQFVSSSPNSWCTVEPFSGTKDIQSISISADENNTNATRTATLRISSEKAKADVFISQYYIEFLTLSQTEFTVGPESQTIEVFVNSNTVLSVEIPTSCSWIHKTEESSLSTESYKFLINENTTDASRTVAIRFYGGKSQLSQTVVIIQDKKNATDSGLASDIEIPGYENDNW